MLALALVGLEAAWTAVHRSPPGLWAGRLRALVILILIITIAGGLGILAGGGRPREVLHFIYALVALGILPVANLLARSMGPRGRSSATLVATLVGLGVVVRLIQTG